MWWVASALFAASLTGSASVPASIGSAEQISEKTCGAPEHRQFDFWLGEWDVWSEQTRKPGKPPAHSRISAIHGGCAILEEYRTPSGYSGSSLSYYDTRDHRWHQTWIDSAGTPLVQTGGLKGASMVLVSEAPTGQRSSIAWTPIEGGGVKQVWRRTQDGGRTWELVFDGVYHRR